MSQSAQQVKSKIAPSLLWKILELGGTQGIQFIVSVILARILSPDEFGTIALITIFITIANTFVQSGFATALIQKKDVQDDDYSSVMWVSLACAVVMYFILYLSAPLISGYYAIPILVSLIRVTGIILFPGALVSIQTSYVARNMQFRKLFIGSLAAVILSGAAAIILAVNGAGVWALSIQQIIYYFTMMLVMLFLISWKPKVIIAMKIGLQFGGIFKAQLWGEQLVGVWLLRGSIKAKEHGCAKGYNKNGMFHEL